MKVYIEKRGAESSAGKIEHARAGRQLGRLAAGDGADLAVFNEDKRMMVEAGSVPESLCGHYRLHGNPLLQVSRRACAGYWMVSW